MLPAGLVARALARLAGPADQRHVPPLLIACHLQLNQRLLTRDHLHQIRRLQRFGLGQCLRSIDLQALDVGLFHCSQRGGQVHCQHLGQRQPACMELIAAAFERQLLPSHLGFGLNLVECGHAPGSDQRLVHLYQLLGPGQCLLGNVQLLLGVKQFAIVQDGTRDHFSHAVFEHQPV
ncbi:hypothetical protein D3C80_1300180 [compost metagenome]